MSIFHSSAAILFVLCSFLFFRGLADRVAILSQGTLVAINTPAGLRQAVAREIRFNTQPAVSETSLAAALNLPNTAVERENDGTVVLHVEPTPARIAELTAWLASQNTLLTELRAGSRSLEQAFLALTSRSAGSRETAP